MRHLHSTTLADVLVAWGRHEALGRFKHQLQSEPATPLECMNLLFHARPRMVAHLLQHKPTASLVVELEPGDESVLRLTNGSTLDEWLSRAADRWLTNVETLVRADEPPAGPVLVVGVLSDAESAAGSVRMNSLILYDGWHRTAAWLLRCRQRRPSRLLANLVVAPRGR